MFTASRYGLLYYVFILLNVKKCPSELLPPVPPSLALYSPGEAEHAPVLVRREREPLTLVCELRGAPPPRRYVWNYLPDGDDAVHEPVRAEPAPAAAGTAGSSTLRRAALRAADSGQYICSAPPFSARKYVLVQPPGVGTNCARGALACGARCVLAGYVCDGHADCAAAEDEAAALCGPRPCAAPDRLNCSSGRCIPAAACCRAAAPLCRQPRCCEEHPAFWRPEGYPEVEFPPLFEDRHAPDDYSFIQSTIYTVTACALIFMIAVVLLVSAICKLHMKRAALRSRPGPAAARFPPCYEASRLMEQRRAESPAPYPAPCAAPCAAPCPAPCPASPRRPPAARQPAAARGLLRLAAVLRPRYSAVPSQCAEVELQPLGSPRSPRSPRSPPLRPRSLALGRLLARRPDTPTVPADDDMDFGRLSHDTYTLNGRTIRLLGGEFESYPPPYNKLYGPPPRYPSGGSLGGSTGSEPPPRYEDLADDVTGGEGNATNSADGMAIGNNGIGNVIDYDDAVALSYGFGNVSNGGVVAASNNDTGNVNNDSGIAEANRNVNDYNVDNAAYDSISNVMDYEVLAANNDTACREVSAAIVNTVTRSGDPNTGISNNVTECNGNISLSAVIDNLPAIDSDVNANDTADACAVMFSNGIDVTAGNGN